MSRPYKVYIEQGHGGKDPGAINERLGLREADINLKMGLELADEVANSDYLFDVLLCRQTDKLVSLAQRVLEAEAWDADVFISIHCNAAVDSQAHGFEVWTSKGDTKSDRLATEIYFAINGAWPEITGRTDYDDGDPDKEANFYVLRNTSMPAVLIEIGFISIDDEAYFLDDPENRKKLLAPIAESIEYFLESGDHEWLPS